MSAEPPVLDPGGFSSWFPRLSLSPRAAARPRPHPAGTTLAMTMTPAPPRASGRATNRPTLTAGVKSQKLGVKSQESLLDRRSRTAQTGREQFSVRGELMKCRATDVD